MNNEETRLTKAPIPVVLVRKLLHRRATTHLGRILSKAYPVDAARLFTSLGSAERSQVFSILLAECDASHVAAVLTEMPTEDSAMLLSRLAPKRIAELLSEMSADDATPLASRLQEPLAAQVLALMEAEPAADVRELLEHEEQTAGRIMTPDYFALEEERTVSDAITALQQRSAELEMVFYLYVVDKRDHLVGVLSLRKLLTTPPVERLKNVMVPNVISAKTDADQEEVARLVAEYNLLALPIVNDDDKLVGIVTVDDVIDVLQDEVAEDLLALAGVATEEHVSTSAARSLRLRAPWLLVNLVTAFLAASVVSLFEVQIGNLPRLAVFMPIVAGMGGNAATQTLTVIIRGIALGEMGAVSWVTIKAIIVGAGNGLINGLAAAAVAGLFYKDVRLGLVLGAAMVTNMIVASIAGTLIPVGLKKVRIDPAVASSVFVTTCTDVAGFFSFLGLATLFMKFLQP
ncbi:MAG TPA: magnesium transporter [Blastocatellia bacterium]|nr:magnesium transporter [Blastocatellia bacterium]